MLKDINEKIRSDLLVERQKLIGFATSEVSCDMFAILLHKRNLISPGFNINHRFFSSEKSTRERFNFDFPNKNQLMKLLISQENYRILLCYGKSKDIKAVEDAIENMNKVKNLIENILGEPI